MTFFDPDAGRSGWVHWVVYGLPASYRGLYEAFLDGEEIVDPGVMVGLNSSELSIYRGPCPPIGSTHHYVFTLYALDSLLDLPSPLTRDELLAAMEGHILAQVELTAAFTR